MGFNPKMVVHDLDDLEGTPTLGKPPKLIEIMAISYTVSTCVTWISCLINPANSARNMIPILRNTATNDKMMIKKCSMESWASQKIEYSRNYTRCESGKTPAKVNTCITAVPISLPATRIQWLMINYMIITPMFGVVLHHFHHFHPLISQLLWFS